MKQSIAELISTARKKKNISMRQLAYLSGISNSEISRIESGERIFPNLKTLKAICRYLDIYYEDCLYILNLGGTYNMNNPFIIEYYKNIDKDNIKTSYENITKKIELNNNQIVYMKQMILKGIKKEIDLKLFFLRLSKKPILPPKLI